ncbi:hypothetical protein ES332_A01G009500v1 [Gossypium tomentosum]|uniref:Cyclase family protein n=1 Tax=Gossypium tomentosum TaxID=34277 RepID=A0A5D2RN77_GOSTO|nr:hypothetical protein ES332_A01G009500v1 [Gossypium tomentosum]
MSSLILLLLSTAIIAAVASIPAYPSVSTDCTVSAADDNPVPVRREVYGDGRIFDISHRYTVDMPSWGSKDGLGQFLWLPSSMKNGSRSNNSLMKLQSVHSGTHVDAPGHMVDSYFDAGFDVDTLDLDVLNGPALLVDVPRDSNITAKVMESLNIPKGVRRVIFRTLNTDSNEVNFWSKKAFGSRGWRCYHQKLGFEEYTVVCLFYNLYSSSWLFS